MTYSSILPGSVKPSVVEWLDITGTENEPELSRRWTLGYVLSTTFTSEGMECTVVGTTWDEDGWSGFSTFPNAIIVSLEEA